MTPIRHRQRLALPLLLASLALPMAAAAEDDSFSLGLVVGDPTGLTLRAGLSDRAAVQAHFGYGFFPGDALSVTVDWTYDAWNFLPNHASVGLLFYMGIGGKGMWFTGRNFVYRHNNGPIFLDNSHFGVGMRGLAGLRLPFRKAPFEIFLEFAPIGLTVIVPDPGVYYDPDAAMGFRYRF